MVAIAQDRSIDPRMHPGCAACRTRQGRAADRSLRRRAAAIHAFMIIRGGQWRESVTAMV